jgi:hypothetical protein
MVTSVLRQGDSSEIAVIRQFKPTRIERELLAQVFELVYHQASADRVSLESAALFTGMLGLVDHSLSGRVEQVVASQPEPRERIA